MIKHSVLRLPVYSGTNIRAADFICDPIDALAEKGWEVIAVLPAISPSEGDTWREIWLRKRDHVRGEYAREPERERANNGKAAWDPDRGWHIEPSVSGTTETEPKVSRAISAEGGHTQYVRPTIENRPSEPNSLTSADNQAEPELPGTPVRRAWETRFKPTERELGLPYFAAGWHAALDAVREHREPNRRTLTAGLAAADDVKPDLNSLTTGDIAMRKVQACWLAMLD